MKFSLDLDLTPLKTAALATIDSKASALTSPWDAKASMHAAKLKSAQAVLAGAVKPPELIAEAAQRKLTVIGLCQLIVTKSDAQQSALLALDAKRQAAKAAVGQATTQPAIAAAVTLLVSA